MSIKEIRECLSKYINKDSYILKDNVLEWVFNEPTFINNLDKEKEYNWGTGIIGNKTRQWTTFLGETIVKEIYNLTEKIQVKRKIKDGNKNIQPDVETDKSIIEVKSRTYCTNGTAGEKILGVPYKYRNIKDITGKNVFIVLVAYQEIEATDKFFLFENKDKNCCKFTDFYEDFGIKYVKFTDIIREFYVNSIPKENAKVFPVLKWAGGKRSIMSQIILYFPHNYNNYYEPFAGGLSVVLHLMNTTNMKNKSIYISDILPELSILYNTIKHNPEQLIEELCKDKYLNSKENFDINKDRYNTIKLLDDIDFIEISALFIFLNKTCFNGLYRENLSGKFNTPYGKYNNPNINDKVNITNLSKVFSNINFSCKSYEIIEPEECDLVYLDPPYHNTFSSYSKSKFTEENHIELKNYMDKLTILKCKVILSNSKTEFIENLYKDYNIIEINTRRIINGKNKENCKELLITNFPFQ
jgi:DNA adenine methylase